MTILETPLLLFTFMLTACLLLKGVCAAFGWKAGATLFGEAFVSLAMLSVVSLIILTAVGLTAAIYEFLFGEAPVWVSLILWGLLTLVAFRWMVWR